MVTAVGRRAYPKNTVGGGASLELAVEIKSETSLGTRTDIALR